MSSLPRALAAAAATLLLAAATPAAHAASAQESSFQDDNALIFSTPEATAQTLDTLAELGVDRVRVSVFWATVAPDPTSRVRPSFDATDPAAYPPGAWDRYDQVVRLAAARGIGVNLDVTSPAPLWATDPNTPRPDIASTYAPDPKELQLFTQALGTRYSGSYQAPAGQPLPRVDYYSIWNEPNQAGWLTPQWTGSDQTGWVEASPRIYRGLVDAAYAGLQASGHGGDTILIGDTAPKGRPEQGTTIAMTPMRFIRQLYCLDDALQPLAGEAARQRGCPETPDQSAGFAAAHPGLFAATGFAHHPYELAASPSARPSDPDYVTIANLPTLSRTLKRIFGIYGQTAPGLPLYLTEFGYNTRPPNPTGVTLANQAAYLDQAEFIARTNPWVQTLTQFLLDDDGRAPDGSVTFQTGLRFADGRPKPAFGAYRLALYLPATRVRRGHKLRVWGLVRPARRLGGRQRVSIQLRAGGHRRSLRRVTARVGSGVVDVRVRIPRSGTLRLAWRDPRTKKVVTSRSVAVHVRRAAHR